MDDAEDKFLPLCEMTTMALGLPVTQWPSWGLPMTWTKETEEC